MNKPDAPHSSQVESSASRTLSNDIRDYALSLGFDLIGITPLGPPPYGAALTDWLRAGYAGEMNYMAQREALRLAPTLLAPDAQSIIMLAANYLSAPAPAAWENPAHGRIARYAWGADYHEKIKPKLFALDAFIRQNTGRLALGKACVDTAPLLERDFAKQAGLGFIGRNTCLIRPGLGSWTFLAALLVPERLQPLAPPAATTNPHLPEMCGQCTRCLDACPTAAFPAARVLDARRCISYLTIELRGPIPRELRPLLGNWVFGCDVCQAICPYNRAAPQSNWFPIPPGEDACAPSILALLGLDEQAFRTRYRGTPIMRSKRRGLLRNACVAAGNWGDPVAIPALTELLCDAEPLIQGHAAWALGCIGGRDASHALGSALEKETNPYVRDELQNALVNLV